MKLAEMKKALALYNHNYKPLPKLKQKYIGVELECIFPAYAELKLFLADAFVKAKLDKKVVIGFDSSINIKKGQTALELKVLDTEKNIATTITQVCSILRSMGCYTNSSCGLHVHLDMRHADEKQREVTFNRLFKSQKFLYSLIDKKRRRSIYCKPIPKTIKFQAGFRQEFNSNTGMFETIYNSSKKVKTNYLNVKELRGGRRGINVNAFAKHKTFEIRMHEGTLNPIKINRWINILMSVVKSNITKPLPVGKSGLKELGL